MVTVAATGAGIALPLLGAGVSHAADAGTWDKVAVCETGGLWSANTNNGFYGGLAITQDTWDMYGGDVFADRPDLASRAQQITVAEKVLAAIGPNAWPGCETGTGLLDDTATPDVDPGDTPAPTAQPSSPADSTPATPTTPVTTPTADPTTAPQTPPVTSAPPVASTTPDAPTADPSAPVDTTDPGAPVTTAPGDPDPTGTASPGGGRHAKPYSPTDEELAAADRASRTQVYAVTENDDDTAATGDGTGTANDGTTGGTPQVPGSDYTVDAGDSLSGIAAAHHVDGGWRHLFAANQTVIGDDPNLIKPGQILNLG